MNFMDMFKKYWPLVIAGTVVLGWIFKGAEWFEGYFADLARMTVVEEVRGDITQLEQKIKTDLQSEGGKIRDEMRTQEDRIRKDILTQRCKLDNQIRRDDALNAVHTLDNVTRVLRISIKNYSAHLDLKHGNREIPPIERSELEDRRQLLVDVNQILKEYRDQLDQLRGAIDNDRCDITR